MSHTAIQAPGNTPYFKLHDWEENLGFDNVFVKDESANPTGTYKDRRSAVIVRHATEERVDKLVLISAGNAAYSLATYAEGTGTEVHAVIDHTLTAGIKEVLRRVCAQVIEVDLGEKILQSDDLIAMVRESAGELIWDVSNGYHDAYREIVRELKRDLPIQPDSIAMPFGGGEAMVGVASGIMEVGWNNGTMVCGFKNNRSERLRTHVIFEPYRNFLDAEKEDLPTPVVDMQTQESSAEVRQNYVPPNIHVEEAGSYTFQGAYLLALRDRDNPNGIRCFGKNLVIINSGYGRVLEEAEARK